MYRYTLAIALMSLAACADSDNPLAQPGTRRMRLNSPRPGRCLARSRSA